MTRSTIAVRCALDILTFQARRGVDQGEAAVLNQSREGRLGLDQHGPDLIERQQFHGARDEIAVTR